MIYKTLEEVNQWLKNQAFTAEGGGFINYTFKGDQLTIDNGMTKSMHKYEIYKLDERFYLKLNPYLHSSSEDLLIDIVVIDYMKKTYLISEHTGRPYVILLKYE